MSPNYCENQIEERENLSGMNIEVHDFVKSVFQALWCMEFVH